MRLSPVVERICLFLNESRAGDVAAKVLKVHGVTDIDSHKLVAAISRAHNIEPVHVPAVLHHYLGKVECRRPNYSTHYPVDRAQDCHAHLRSYVGSRAPSAHEHSSVEDSVDTTHHLSALSRSPRREEVFAMDVHGGIGRAPPSDEVKHAIRNYNPVSPRTYPDPRGEFEEELSSMHANLADIKPLKPNIPHSATHTVGTATYKGYTLDTPEKADAQCWGGNFCVARGGSASHMNRNYHDGEYKPIHLITKQVAGGKEHMHAAYLPELLPGEKHEAPLQAVRNAGNNGAHTGKDFDDIHPLLRKLDPRIDKVASQYSDKVPYHPVESYAQGFRRHDTEGSPDISRSVLQKISVYLGETASYRKLDRGDPGAYFKVDPEARKSMDAEKEWGRPEAPRRDVGDTVRGPGSYANAARGYGGQHSYAGAYKRLRAEWPELPLDLRKRAAKAKLTVTDSVRKWQAAGIPAKHIAGPHWRLNAPGGADIPTPQEAVSNLMYHPHLHNGNFKELWIGGVRSFNDVSVEELHSSGRDKFLAHLSAAGVDEDDARKTSRVVGLPGVHVSDSLHRSLGLPKSLSGRAAIPHGLGAADVRRLAKGHVDKIKAQTTEEAKSSLHGFFANHESLPRLKGLPEWFHEASTKDAPKLANWCVNKNACLHRAVKGEFGKDMVPDRVAVHPGTGHVVGLKKQDDGSYKCEYASHCTDSNNSHDEHVFEKFGESKITE